MPNNNEHLGPAERIIQTLLAYSDHLVHNRTGFVQPTAGTPTGVTWSPATYKANEAGERVVYTLSKVAKKEVEHRQGILQPNNLVFENGRHVGRFQPAGLFPEVAVWMYRQVAEVWKLDNEFAAKWASHAYAQDHKDLKTVLAAFMLVQSRKGDPIKENGKVAFFDSDFRDVGEAMLLSVGKTAMSPKLVIRIFELLSLPEIAAINRELGFGRSLRHPFYGRWARATEQWLGFREDNPKMFAGLVKAGFGGTVRKLAEFTAHANGGYKPRSPKFYESLRWKQNQAKTGHRSIAIGQTYAADTWNGLSEAEVCDRITKERPGWKRIVGLVPKEVGITRAVAAAAIEAGCLSDKDLIILTPTLEELGLLEVQTVKERWQTALKAADDMRAANIAKNVKTKEAREKLNEAADVALQKAVAEVMRDLRVYFYVDISGSMQHAIESAKLHLARFVQGFPMDRLHVAVFNSVGREITIPHASATGVENAFRGITAGGGTSYGQGVKALAHRRLKDGEDAICIFVGDEEQPNTFEDEFRRLGLSPLAFGFVRVGSPHSPYTAVRQTAANLSIPCFMIDERTFADPYAIPRTIQNLIAATPVSTVARPNVTPRVTLIDTIMRTPLLSKPAWAT